MKIGKVYKIICSQSNDVYIGSTFNTLRDRWMDHKNRYRVYQKNKSRNMSIHTYFDKYGIDNFKIILIKEYEVVDRKHLESKEQLWINKLKNINIQSAFNPMRNNKLSKNERLKQYRYLTYTCSTCNIELVKKGKAKHERTKKHLRALNN
jgi:group I intron endonuclease